MKKELFNGLPLWQFDILKNQTHFVTSRHGGISPSPFDGLNLSKSAGDSLDNVFENRRLLAQSIGLEADDLVFVNQCHSAEIAIITEKSDPKQAIEADAMVTNLLGLCICVMGADCVPVLIYDPVRKVVAAVHAGWKGTVASILSKTLEKMHVIYGSQFADLIVAIGPSISQAKYEVGEEVYLKFKEAFGQEIEPIFKHDKTTNKYFPDLWLANKMQALKLGVLEKNIEIAEICTYSNPDEFFSARYFQNKTGRFAAGIVL